MGIDRYTGRVAIVTGASTGIGAVIVQVLLKHGINVVGVARRAEKVQELALKDGPGKLFAIKADASNEEDILKIFSWIKENLGGADILINNAGTGGDNPLSNAPTDEWKRTLDLNILGLSIFTREALKSMLERNVDDGYIIHISSSLAHSPPMSSGLAMYTATKHAVKVLTEGLRKDLVARQSKIRVTAISPGLVKTEFLKNMNTFTPDIAYSSLPYLLPEDVAEAVVYALSQHPRVQVQDMIILPTGSPQ